MLRPQIFSENFVTPGLGPALRAHHDERDALRMRLIALYRAEPLIRAAWLWGSFGRGDADDLSDLDPWLIVPDAAAATMGAVLQAIAALAGPLIASGESPHNAPPRGGYLGCLYAGTHGLLPVDCYWQPASAVASCPAAGLLFNRMGEPSPIAVHSPVSPVSADDPFQDAVQGGVGFMWLMLSIAAKGLARSPDSDMSLALYPRDSFEKALVALGNPVRLTPPDWAVPAEPLAKVEWLRSLVEKADAATVAAIAQGIVISQRYAACLLAYLDIVAGILSERGTGAG